MKDQNRTCEILMHEWKQKHFLIMEDPHRFIEEFISTKKSKEVHYSTHTKIFNLTKQGMLFSVKSKR